MIIIAIICLLLLVILDDLITCVYCHLSKMILKKNDGLKQRGDVHGRGELDNKKALRKIYRFYGGWIRYKLIRLGRFPCHLYRILKLKYIYCMNLDKKVVIYGGFEIRSPWNITIGEGSVIGDEVKLDGRNEIIIGNNVQFSTGVWVWTEQHDLNDPFFAANNKGGKVVINDRAWISSRTVILPGVHIGEGAVVASGAVVTKDCQSFKVYGGIPAQEISDRNADLKYVFSGSHLPFW